MTKSTEKLDLHTIHKAEYIAPQKPLIVQTSPATYLAIEGQGEPGGAAFTDRIGALYAIAFTVKMTRKFAGLQDYTVCKLEGQWWGLGNACLSQLPKDQWCWKLLIRTPDFIADADLAKARCALLDKGKTESVADVKLETLDEGTCLQMLHVGPYDNERETIAIMVAYAEKNGLKPNGHHHEIYLSDPRRVPPARLKTILRFPVLAA